MRRPVLVAALGLALGLAGCAGPGGSARAGEDSAATAPPVAERPVGIGVGADFRIEAPPSEEAELRVVNRQIGDAICALLRATERTCRTDADVREGSAIVAQQQMLGVCQEGECFDPMVSDYVLFAGVAEEGAGYRLAVVLVDREANEVLAERETRLEALDGAAEKAVGLVREALGQR